MINSFCCCCFSLILEGEVYTKWCYVGEWDCMRHANKSLSVPPPPPPPLNFLLGLKNIHSLDVVGEDKHFKAIAA